MILLGLKKRPINRADWKKVTLVYMKGLLAQPKKANFNKLYYLGCNYSGEPKALLLKRNVKMQAVR